MEDLAIQFVSKSEDEINAISIGVFLVGFVIALLARSGGRDELQRAPYFALAALLYVFGSAFSFVWLFALQAATHGFLWLLLVADLLVRAALGYFLGVIALARARDGFGTVRHALLSVIPLANLWLLLKQSRNAASANRLPVVSLLSGGTGVLTGFALLVLGAGLTTYLKLQLEQSPQSASMQDQIAIAIQTKGLEETLRMMASMTQLPIAIDEVTTLSAVNASGSRLQRTFVVTLDHVTIGDSFRSQIDASVCGYAPFITLMRAGAVIEESYVDANGRPIGGHVVSASRCGL